MLRVHAFFNDGFRFFIREWTLRRGNFLNPFRSEIYFIFVVFLKENNSFRVIWAH